MHSKCSQHVLATLIAEPERLKYFTPECLAASSCAVVLSASGRQEFGEPRDLQAI